MIEPFALIAIGFMAGVVVTAFLMWAACVIGGPNP